MTTSNTEKMCISCGMPMRSPEDHALGDTSKEFCKHCSTETGELKSREEVLKGISGFLMHTQGLDEGAALEAAALTMNKMPAWREG